MTDEQVINNLKCCVKLISGCSQCSYRFNEDIEFDCEEVLVQDTLDLINRQKAEIERLNGELQAMRGAANSYRVGYEGANKFPYEIQVEVSKKVENEIKFEAIKEFAKRLEGHKCMHDRTKSDMIFWYHIDSLVKEMTEVQA